MSTLRVLYLSYDGMTDPLGSSQVMPYLRGLAALGHQITIVSAEKPERYLLLGGEIGRQLDLAGIDWSPIEYHKRPPMLSTVWDVRAMRRRAFEIARAKKVQLVHCRSYVPSLVGLKLKRKLGTRFLFDMRGFWADERVDGGLWNLKKPQYNLAFRFFKAKERRFLEESDRVVSLTHAGKKEMGHWGLSPGSLERIDIIPCCADLKHFDRQHINLALRERLMRELSLGPRDFVVSYLGSLGTWYMLDEMLAFFAQLKQTKPNAKLLFITPDDPRWIREAADRAGVELQSLRILEASRPEVPTLLSLSQLGLFFIKPAYSKLSSSPTKLAEILAMGVPVVTNAGVGDSDWISDRFKLGGVVKEFTPAGYEKVIQTLPDLLAIPPERIRAAAEDYFSLQEGIESYQRIYTRLGEGLK